MQLCGELQPLTARQNGIDFASEGVRKGHCVEHVQATYNHVPAECYSLMLGDHTVVNATQLSRFAPAEVISRSDLRGAVAK